MSAPFTKDDWKRLRALLVRVEKSTASQNSADKQGLLNLPKKARLDLLTQITLQKLVEGYETKAIVDAVLEEIEHTTDREELRDMKIGGWDGQ